MSLHSPSNSAIGCSSSTCCDTTFTMTMIGMPSNMPHIPHSHPHNSSEVNTAAAFILAIRPVIHVVTNVPTMVATASEMPATSSAIGNESNCMNAAIPAAAAVTPGPRYGMT